MNRKSNKPFAIALNHLLKSGHIKNMTQSKIAEKLQVTQQHISKIAKGERDGKEEIRRKIAQIFGFEYDDFLKLGEEILAVAEEKGKKGFLKTQSIPYSIGQDAPDECNATQRRYQSHEPLPDFFRNNNQVNGMLKDIQERDPGDIKSIIDYIRYIHDRKKP